MFDIKRAANWTVLILSFIYGFWSFVKLLGVFFILGDNDTGFAMLSFFMFGLLPGPTALIAIRWRKTAALLFFLVAALTVAGFIDDEVYIANRNGIAPDVRQALMSSLKFVWPLLIFSVFYLATDLVRWSTIRQLRTPPQTEA